MSHQKSPLDGVFFKNLRAETVREYGTGSSLGWVNVLAAKAGENYNSVLGEIEQYKETEPPYRVVNKYAKLLGLTPDTLSFERVKADPTTKYYRAMEKLFEDAEVAQYERDEALEKVAAMERRMARLENQLSIVSGRM